MLPPTPTHPPAISHCNCALLLAAGCRFAFDANVTAHDALFTYMLPWQILAAEGGNAGAMCAYPSVNGEPAPPMQPCRAPPDSSTHI